MSTLTGYGRPVSVMVVVEEEGSVSMPFSLEDSDSWTGITGSSRFDDEDGGIRTGRGERAPVPAMATGGVDERVSRHCLERELCHQAVHYQLSYTHTLRVYHLLLRV
jgi:hypothetical protein